MMPSTLRRRLGALAAVSLLLLAAIGLWQSATVPGPQSLEARTQAIAAVLRCPTCQNLSAADSPSATAQSMRDTIAEQLAAGRTDEEVLDWFVERYGPWVLLHPPREGLNWVLWTTPIAVLALAAAAARRLLRGSADGAPLDADAEERVEELYQRHLRGEDVAPGGGPAGERLDAALELLATVRQDYEGEDEGALPSTGGRRAHRLAAREVLAALNALERAERRAGTKQDVPAARRRLTGWGIVTAAFLLAVGVLLPSAVGVRGVGAVATGSTGGAPPAEVLSDRLADGPAIVALREAVSEDPDDVDARRALAEALADHGRLAEAVAHYRQVLVAEPDDTQLRVTLGVLLLQLGAYEDAEQELRALLAEQPDHTEGLLVTGLAQIARGEDAGTTTLRRFLELAPENHPGVPLAQAALDPDRER